MSERAARPHDDPADGLSTAPVRRVAALVLLFWVFLGVAAGFAAFDYGVGIADSKQGADGGNRSIFTDERLGWLNRPHFENPAYQTRLDRFGLRSPEIPDDAPLDELRLAGFGASNVYGAGGALQPWCWNYKLETLVQGRVPAARVHNGGVMAYSALQSCRLAASLLEALEPDLVMVLVSPSAQLMLDPSSAARFVRVADGPGGLVPQDVVAGWPGFLKLPVARTHRWLNEWSALYRRQRAKFQVNDRRDTAIQRWMVSRAPRPAAVDAMYQRTLEEFSILAEACRERGVELRVGILVDLIQDSDKAWANFLRNNQLEGAPPLDTPRREPIEVLREDLEARGIVCWDFFEEADRMGQDRRAFLMPDDAHWNEAGHLVLARGIFKRLEAEGLLETLRQRRAAKPRTRPYGDFPFDPEGS